MWTKLKHRGIIATHMDVLIFYTPPCGVPWPTFLVTLSLPADQKKLSVTQQWVPDHHGTVPHKSRRLRVLHCGWLHVPVALLVTHLILVREEAYWAIYFADNAVSRHKLNKRPLGGPQLPWKCKVRYTTCSFLLVMLVTDSHSISPCKYHGQITERARAQELQPPWGPIEFVSHSYHMNKMTWQNV